MSKRSKRRLAQAILREAKQQHDIPPWISERSEQEPPTENARQRRRSERRAKAELAVQYRDVRIPGVKRPQEPGDTCYKCGDSVVFKETKRTPKKWQTYAYHGYLHCPTCKTLYHCDQYRYTLGISAPVQPQQSEDERERQAIDKARRDWLSRVNRPVRLVKH